MDKRLTDALERHPAVHDWTARRQIGRGAQIYLVGNQVENVRQIERESYEVELFNDHQADGEPSRGAAKVPVSRGPRAAAGGAGDGHHHGQPGQQPALVPAGAARHAGGGAGRRLVDFGRRALAAAREAADRIRALAANEAANDVRLSAAELFVTTIEEELRNSRGLTGTSSPRTSCWRSPCWPGTAARRRSTSARPRRGAWPTCASTRR